MHGYSSSWESRWKVITRKENFMEKKNFGEKYIGHVIRILSNTKLIIDVGDDFLTIGDKVIIYAVGDELYDLTGNSLGLYEYDKIALNVISTTSTYSVCETSKTTERASVLFDYAKAISKEVTTQEHFNVAPEDIHDISIENKDRVLIGDLVKKA